MAKKYSCLLVLLFYGCLSFCQAKALHFLTKENTRVALHATYFYHFNADDSLHSSIHYSIDKLPNWLSYNPQQQSLSGVAPDMGQYEINIMAVSNKDTVRQPFMLTVYNKQTTNILCLGNSLTNGTSVYNSYRRHLWQLLHKGSYNFDLIGSWSKHHAGGQMPDADFDLDHEGHSGWTFEDILKPPSWDSARGNLRTWLTDYTPDIVLIELGTNDVFQCRTPGDMFGNLNVIIYLLRNKNKKVKIFLAQIPPLGAQWSDKKLCGNDTSYADAIVDFNQRIAMYAKEHRTAESPVFAVDQYTGVNPSTDIYDDIHPNEKGEVQMAQRWFVAIEKYIKKL